jgi:hypothetical protein
MKRSQIQLTWPGFDAAVDLIAAQCQSTTRSGVYSPSEAGSVLAIALADRLSLRVLKKPEDKMLLVEAWAWNKTLAESAHAYSGVEVWVWVDTTDGCYNSVCRLSGISCVAMPWQDAALGCLEHFLPNFHD